MQIKHLYPKANRNNDTDQNIKNCSHKYDVLKVLPN
jgi:hypothetical protein